MKLLLMFALGGSLAWQVLLGLAAVGLLAWASHLGMSLLRDQRARRRQVQNRRRLRTEFWGYE